MYHVDTRQAGNLLLISLASLCKLARRLAVCCLVGRRQSRCRLTRGARARPSTFTECSLSCSACASSLLPHPRARGTNQYSYAILACRALGSVADARKAGAMWLEVQLPLNQTYTMACVFWLIVKHAHFWTYFQTFVLSGI